MVGKPKATAIKLLTGNPGKRPLPENEPQPEGEVICPASVSKDADAQKIWDYYAPMLEAQGVLTCWDVHMFGAWCCLVAEFECDPRRFNAADLSQMRGLGSAFGLDGPKSRAQMSVGDGKKKDKDPAEKYFRRPS